MELYEREGETCEPGKAPQYSSEIEIEVLSEGGWNAAHKFLRRDAGRR